MYIYLWVYETVEKSRTISMFTDSVLRNVNALTVHKASFPELAEEGKSVWESGVIIWGTLGRKYEGANIEAAGHALRWRAGTGNWKQRREEEMTGNWKPGKLQSVPECPENFAPSGRSCDAGSVCGRSVIPLGECRLIRKPPQSD